MIRDFLELNKIYGKTMKLNILAVDKNPSILSQISELLNSSQFEGKFYFTQTIEEGISIIEQNEITIVICELNTPQINGIDFLEVLKDDFPSIVRIVLFDHENQIELLLKSVVSAHKFISKPIDSEKFYKIITQTILLNSFLIDEKVLKVLNHIDSFPALPQTYIEIEEELNKENFAIKNISDIVHKDMAIATRILQVVNSPLFGLAKNITDIQQAISLLGITMLKSLILYTQIFRSFEGNMRVENIQKEIWEHSLKVANTSKLLVANFGNRNEIETAFISGLLHDVGKIIIINNEKFIFEILELMKSENIEYNEAEYKILGTTHAEIGAYLLSLWGLPSIIVDSIKNHHKIYRVDNNILSVQSAIFIANEYNVASSLDSKLLLESGLENLMPQILSICS